MRERLGESYAMVCKVQTNDIPAKSKSSVYIIIYETADALSALGLHIVAAPRSTQAHLSFIAFMHCIRTNLGDMSRAPKVYDL